jgi:hypothetical protein
MIWRPILMTDSMAQASFDGRKTQTRRPVKPQPDNPGTFGISPIWGSGIRDDHYTIHAATNVNGERVDQWIKCPFGQPGDGLYVREAWQATVAWTSMEYVHCNHYVDDFGRNIPETTNEIQVENEPRFYYRAAWDGWHEDDESEQPGKSGCVWWRPSIHMPKWAARTWLKNNSIWVEKLHDITEAGARAEGFKDRAEFLAWWRTAYKGKPWAEDQNPWVFVDDFHKTTKPSEV